MVLGMAITQGLQEGFNVRGLVVFGDIEREHSYIDFSNSIGLHIYIARV